eukprot:g9535.t1
MLGRMRVGRRQSGCSSWNWTISSSQSFKRVGPNFSEKFQQAELKKNATCREDELSVVQSEVQGLKKIVANKDRKLRDDKKKLLKVKNNVNQESQELVEEKDELLMKVEELQGQVTFHKKKGNKLATELAEAKKEKRAPSGKRERPEKPSKRAREESVSESESDKASSDSEPTSGESEEDKFRSPDSSRKRKKDKQEKKNPRTSAQSIPAKSANPDAPMTGPFT